MAFLTSCKHADTIQECRSRVGASSHGGHGLDVDMGVRVRAAEMPQGMRAGSGMILEITG